jgi:hypothetical protein
MISYFTKTVVFWAMVMTLAPGIVSADPMEKSGTTPYVTHFVFRPLETVDVPGAKVTAFEATGITDNLEGGKMLDKMSARCEAINVDFAPKKYIDGACVLTDADGDMIFSTFDTRDVDKALGEKGACGTHIITGGTGKYAGITGKEPFACDNMPALAGAGGYTSMNIPHVTTWEVK